ncbi:hypothetical protein VTO42DRAFT_2614 [Malbranchea cinnamomea]
MMEGSGQTWHDEDGYPDGAATQYNNFQHGDSRSNVFHDDRVRDSCTSLDLDECLAPARRLVTLSEEEQEQRFRTLRDMFEDIDEKDEPFDSHDLLFSLDVANAHSRRDCQYLKALHEVKVNLDQLWKCGSSYMAQATELLANGSRNPKWRAPFGSSGILDFYLQVVTTVGVHNDVLLHALRLIGNSCADTDENRQLVVQKNYTMPIIKLFHNPALVHVALPVIYNICIDFEPAQVQIASNGIIHILLKLLVDGLIEGDALLTCAYELVEVAFDQGHAVDELPSDTLRLLFALTGNSALNLSHFLSSANCVLACLQKERFQQLCITDGLVDNILTIMQWSYQFKHDISLVDNEASLAQLRLKINQTLSDISALPIFPLKYSLSSSLVVTLLSWLKETEKDQLKVCACIMLGNVAREDAICESLIRDFEVHLRLISILNSNTTGCVLHAALGFLKNLAIAGDNREYLGAAGIIKALSRLWAFDPIPYVQLMATGLTRQVIASSLPNIKRLLEPLSTNPDSPENSRTYLSLLLSLFAKTDSLPIRTEIGRIMAAICRSLMSRNEVSSTLNGSPVLIDRLFSLHEGVARPIGAMITQTEWPVVQSEGWFALALMASTYGGSQAAVDCIENMSVAGVLGDIVRTQPLESRKGESAEVSDNLRKMKDRDNAIVLIHGLLKHNPPGLTKTLRDLLEDLMFMARINTSTYGIV